MAYEEMEVWVVPKVGDWVLDKRNLIWRIKYMDTEKGARCERITAGGKRTVFKNLSQLTRIEDSMAKLLTSAHEEK